MHSKLITIVIPVLNEADQVSLLLEHINALPCRVVVVDGGSDDDTVKRISSGCAPNVCISGSAPGRAKQMNTGAGRATTPYLLFLHADTVLPGRALDCVVETLHHDKEHWGRFDVKFDDAGWLFKVIAYLMNRRSTITGICTGDQAIFVKTRTFHRCGGFAEIPLMEDVELSSRLRLIAMPISLHPPVVTAARRWRGNGPLRTILQMWSFRLMYWMGRSPESLAIRYNHAR